jgi:hypothetical protein
MICSSVNFTPYDFGFCQAANWFSNAQVWLWKPSVVELHEGLKKSPGAGNGSAQPVMELLNIQYVVG